MFVAKQALLLVVFCFVLNYIFCVLTQRKNSLNGSDAHSLNLLAYTPFSGHKHTDTARTRPALGGGPSQPFLLMLFWGPTQRCSGRYQISFLSLHNARLCSCLPHSPVPGSVTLTRLWADHSKGRSQACCARERRDQGQGGRTTRKSQVRVPAYPLRDQLVLEHLLSPMGLCIS